MTRSRLARYVSERGQQGVPILAAEALRRQVTEGLNRPAELIKVAVTPYAVRQVINQATFSDRIERSIQESGHQFDELDAGEVADEVAAPMEIPRMASLAGACFESNLRLLDHGFGAPPS